MCQVIAEQQIHVVINSILFETKSSSCTCLLARKLVMTSGLLETEV